MAQIDTSMNTLFAVGMCFIAWLILRAITGRKTKRPKFNDVPDGKYPVLLKSEYAEPGVAITIGLEIVAGGYSGSVVPIVFKSAKAKRVMREWKGNYLSVLAYEEESKAYNMELWFGEAENRCIVNVKANHVSSIARYGEDAYEKVNRLVRYLDQEAKVASDNSCGNKSVKRAKRNASPVSKPHRVEAYAVLYEAHIDVLSDLADSSEYDPFEDWRFKEPTSRQIEKLRGLGGEEFVTSQMTRGDISDLIGIAIKASAEDKRQLKFLGYDMPLGSESEARRLMLEVNADPALVERLLDMPISAEEKRDLTFLRAPVFQRMTRRDYFEAMSDLERERGDDNEKGRWSRLDDLETARDLWALLQLRSAREELGINKPGKDLFWKSIHRLRSRHRTLEHLEREQLVDEMLVWRPGLLRRDGR